MRQGKVNDVESGNAEIDVAFGGVNDVGSGVAASLLSVLWVVMG